MSVRKWRTGILATLLFGPVTIALSGASGGGVTNTGAAAGNRQAKTGNQESGVEYFDAARVEQAFSSGKTLINGGEGRNYKVMGLRRHGPGVVEVHNTDTDIFYVIEGEATFVTGGTLTGGEHTAANEIRGGTLAGGEAHHLGKGDVIVIPKGVPHWFKEVSGSIEYFVVKVR
jgi:quercetin dioxygenase-like cupin family protein